MIGRIKGNIVLKGDKYLIIDVQGVGYKVHTRDEIISSFENGNELTLWTYTAVRENSLDLYGFISTEELSFFEMLLNVSGIGPKSAVSILGIAPIDTLARAIATGDTNYLNKVSGIGRKTADKIVIELRDRLKSWKGEGVLDLNEDKDVVEALKSLGYSQNEARDAIKDVPNNVQGTNDRIKEALKILNK